MMRLRLSAFTLVEVLVALAVLTLLMVMLLATVSHAMSLWQDAEGLKSRQQSARQAITTLSRDLSAAVFPPWSSGGRRLSFLANPGFADFENPDFAMWTAAVSEQSNAGDLAEVGYFVAWSPDANGRDQPELRRFVIPATDANSIFTNPGQSINATTVESLAPGSTATPPVGLVATNVLGLWFSLFAADGSALPLPYDSENAVDRPAFVEVTLAVTDPRSAVRLPDKSEITSRYNLEPAEFARQLTADFGLSVQIFRHRAFLAAGQSRP